MKEATDVLNHMLRRKRLGKGMRKSCRRKEGAGSPVQSVPPPHSPPLWPVLNQAATLWVRPQQVW